MRQDYTKVSSYLSLSTRYGLYCRTHLRHLHRHANASAVGRVRARYVLFLQSTIRTLANYVQCNGKDPCDWCTDQDLACTYEAPANLTSQVLVPSSQPEAVAEASRKASPAVEDNATEPSQEVALQKEAVATAHKAAAQEAPRAEDLISREIPPQDATPPRMLEAQSIDPDATLIEAAPFPQNAGTTPALHLAPAPATDLLALLHREPAFAQSNQLGSWANLPEPMQRSSLETWMCQQLNDPGFSALVKRLDESWQTNLFSMSVGMDT